MWQELHQVFLHGLSHLVLIAILKSSSSIILILYIRKLEIQQVKSKDPDLVQSNRVVR